ncbi:YwmB family TATA-box binding protein [Virgibacillus necropolis]|nr:YwmB family TATA-box binding protein [Virgibacillus necropolis]
MKKIALIFILILCIANQVSAHDKTLAQDEMTQLADLTGKADLKVDQWQVTFKENMSKDRLLDLINKWENSYLDSYSEDENVIKYLFRNVQKNAGIVEIYTIIIPKNTEYKPELISVISGSEWNETIKARYLELQGSIVRKYFSENVTKFSCLTTKSNDTIKGSSFVNLLKDKLQLRHLTTQVDNVEKSMNKKIVYGYTPLWSQTLKILDKPVNVNIVITDTTNGETKLTVGTPILINEY